MRNASWYSPRAPARHRPPPLRPLRRRRRDLRTMAQVRAGARLPGGRGGCRARSGCATCAARGARCGRRRRLLTRGGGRGGAARERRAAGGGGRGGGEGRRPDVWRGLEVVVQRRGGVSAHVANHRGRHLRAPRRTQRGGARAAGVPPYTSSIVPRRVDHLSSIIYHLSETGDSASMKEKGRRAARTCRRWVLGRPRRSIKSRPTQR
jgi:hypothetical protein